MVEMLVGPLVIALFFVVPIVWRVKRERAENRALAIHAEVAEALRRALGGESLVSVAVLPVTTWRSGRVMLSTPTGCEALLEAVWHPVLTVLPHGYELVIQGAPRTAGSTVRAAA